LWKFSEVAFSATLLQSIFTSHQERGHVPVGQLEPPEVEDVPLSTANVEKIFSVALEPHFSHAWLFLDPAFSRKAVT
jgi:hypothetical protein